MTLHQAARRPTHQKHDDGLPAGSPSARRSRRHSSRHPQRSAHPLPELNDPRRRRDPDTRPSTVANAAFSAEGRLTDGPPAGEHAVASGGCAGPGASAYPELRGAELRTAPRRARTRPRPRGLWPARLIDARLLTDALWLLRTYGLRVTAAREGGHNTHGDGTALDLVPADPADQAPWYREP
jgi:hypothetical protein